MRRKQWHDEVCFLDVALEKGAAHRAGRSLVEIFGWFMNNVISQKVFMLKIDTAAFLKHKSLRMKEFFVVL